MQFLPDDWPPRRDTGCAGSPIDCHDHAVRWRGANRVGKFGELYQDRYWHKRQFETVEKLGDIAKLRGEPLAKLSIAWVLANPVITSALLGASRLDQLTDTLAAVDVQLDGELKKHLDELTVENRRGDAIL